MPIKKIMLLTATFLILISCQNKSSSKGGGNDNGGNAVTEQKVQDELGYNPNERWKDKGDYSYNFSFTYNGVKCETNKRYNGKAKYCLGLQNEELNNDCAFESRKTLYTTACGNDFHAMKVKADAQYIGFDTRLQKTCEAAAPEIKRFLFVKDYCKFLANEDLHRECHWDRRKAKFKELDCKGYFSAEPPKHAVTQPPQIPQPTLTPIVNPEDSRLSNIPIIQELKAAGITVAVNWNYLYSIDEDRRYFEGEEDDKKPLRLDEQLKIVWDELSSVKSKLIDRKLLIRKITINGYSKYNELDGELDLQFNLVKGDADLFIQKLDRLIEYQAYYGLEFSDTIGSFYEKDRFQLFERILAMFEKYEKEFLDLKGVIKIISLDSYSHYSFYNQELQLDQDNGFELELVKYFKLLDPIKLLMKSVSKINYNRSLNNKEEIKLEFDFKLEEDQAIIKKYFEESINPEIETLEYYFKNAMINELSIEKNSSDIRYFEALKKLEIPLKNSNPNINLHGVLESLKRHFDFTQKYLIDFDFNNYKIDEDTIKGFSNFEKLESLIITKVKSIKEIKFSNYYTTFYESSKVLVLGLQTDINETKKIIENIKTN